MKIKKPEDEKYFKDIVLNDILEEISNEEGVIVDKTFQQKKSTSSKKILFAKTLFFILIATLFLLFIITLFVLITDATTDLKSTAKTDKNTSVHVQKSKRKKEPSNFKQTSTLKVIEKKPILTKKVQSKLVEVKVIKKMIPLTQEEKVVLERKKAKAALRQQMLN